MNINIDKLYMITEEINKIIDRNDLPDFSVKIETDNNDLKKIDEYFKNLNPNDMSNNGECDTVHVNFFGVNVEITKK